MTLFSKKEKIYLYSEAQKDEFIEKMEASHIKYDLREERDVIHSDKTTYIVRLNAADYKKVI